MVEGLIAPAVFVEGSEEQEPLSDVYGKPEGSSWRAAVLSGNVTVSGAAARPGQDPSAAVPGSRARTGWSCGDSALKACAGMLGLQCRPGRNQDPRVSHDGLPGDG